MRRFFPNTPGQPAVPAPVWEHVEGSLRPFRGGIYAGGQAAGQGGYLETGTSLPVVVDPGSASALNEALPAGVELLPLLPFGSKAEQVHILPKQVFLTGRDDPFLSVFLGGVDGGVSEFRYVAEEAIGVNRTAAFPSDKRTRPGSPSVMTQIFICLINWLPRNCR